MKINRTRLFIVTSSAALIILLLIQVKWIIETARVKEALFNEKANMVLTKTAEVLFSDPETCRSLDAGMILENPRRYVARPGKDEKRTIDSLLTYYMNFYDLHLDYNFKVIKTNTDTVRGENGIVEFIPPPEPSCNKINLEAVANSNGLELEIIYPEKVKYIRAEMGTIFTTSVLLIIVVLVLFWKTIHSLSNEKRISERTTDFLNNMTHEFKTPLTNIALAGKMITRNPQPDKLEYYSSIILGENEKLKHQVDHVLSLTALERGEIPLDKSKVDFHKLIDDVVLHNSIQIEDKNGVLDLDLQAENPEITGDRTHLTNALRNLLDNAIKYAKETPEITISTRNEDQLLKISVTDKGIGIDREFRGKIFDKYFRVPTGDVHNVKGFGLGLTYIKMIIELQGGTIELEDKKDTTFTITFPNA